MLFSGHLPTRCAQSAWTQWCRRCRTYVGNLVSGAAMNNTVLGFAIMCAALAGCAKSSGEVTGSYVSPLQYQNYTCAQLGEEAQRISAHVAQTSGVQDKKRSNDQVATTAAIILFWPAAFLVGGDDQNTAELSRLKGEFESIEKVPVQKNCNLQFKQQTAPPAATQQPKA